MSGGDGRVGPSGAGTAAGAARGAGSLRAGVPGADTPRAGRRVGVEPATLGRRGGDGRACPAPCPQRGQPGELA